MQLEVTTKADMYPFLTYWKEGQKLVQVMCRSAALNISHEKDKAVFQSIRTPILWPDHRTNANLAFPPHKCIATRELRRWIQKGSIIPFVEALAGKAGRIDRDNADAYLVREIMCTGMALAPFFD